VSFTQATEHESQKFCTFHVKVVIEGSRSLFLIFIAAFIKPLPKCVMLDYFNSYEDLHGDNV